MNDRRYQISYSYEIWCNPFIICFSNGQENTLNPDILSSNNLKHYMLAFGGLNLYFITLKWKVQINIM